ncbi:GNAT family N-acetyltransferase [Lacticaseibacillus parakribbianus]|uniref:GNAT family N-acetyltransferase n=1 Tax=Lacticaseibacillus parakribbianus TaxID=2970927 RepID=UPI0021CB528A|nr:GNAT family N-acetyltransferase [Lacticaseibacillus parakribbianus]
MSSQTEYDQVYAKRLAAIEKDPQFTILSSMNRPQADGETKATQYIVYTDYKLEDKKRNSFTVSVYTPFENVDKYGHSKADFQSQLLFDLNRWQATMHITVLETLGSESRLAFYDFQNMGLATLALKAFINLAKKAGVKTIDGNLSSFDRDNFAKLTHLFEKFGFAVTVMDAEQGIGKITLSV